MSAISLFAISVSIAVEFAAFRADHDMLAARMKKALREDEACHIRCYYLLSLSLLITPPYVGIRSADAFRYAAAFAYA